MTDKNSRRALIVYAGWHGQTELIAKRLGLIAKRRGYTAEVVRARDANRRADLASFNRIVVCAGVQMQRHHRDARTFVTDQAAVLAAHPSCFVSVSLSAGAPNGSPDRVGVEHVVDRFLDVTGWAPRFVILAAGALHYTRYGFFTRWMMRKISAAHGGPTDTSRDHELTDWSLLERDAAEVFPEKLEAQHTAVL